MGIDPTTKVVRISREQATALQEAIDRRRLNHKEAVELVARCTSNYQESHFGYWMIHVYYVLLLVAMGAVVLSLIAAFILLRGWIFFADFTWKFVAWFFA